VGAAVRAVRVREAGGVPAGQLAASRFVLARALWESRQDRERARALARQAADSYAELGASKADALAEVEAWLAEHGRVAP
jgi:ribosomal protein S9